MGDLFLDIDNTIFHVLLKQGVGKKSILEGTFSSSFYSFISSTFFFFWLVLLVFCVFFFLVGGLGLLVSLKNLTTCKI